MTPRAWLAEGLAAAARGSADGEGGVSPEGGRASFNTEPDGHPSVTQAMAPHPQAFGTGDTIYYVVSLSSYGIISPRAQVPLTVPLPCLG